MLFIGGALLALIAIIIGLVGLVRGGHRFLSLLPLIVGLVPAAVILVLWLVNHSYSRWIRSRSGRCGPRPGEWPC